MVEIADQWKTTRPRLPAGSATAMKAIDKLIEALPIPLLCSIAAVALCAWALKEWRTYPAWGSVLKDTIFQVALVLMACGTLAYYLVTFIINSHSPSQFAEGQKGVAIARFVNDASGKVQLHVGEALTEAAALELTDIRVAIQKLEVTVESSEYAQQLLRETRAQALLWGTFVPDSVVYVKASLPGSPREGHLSVTDFPKTDKFGSSLLKAILPPTAADRKLTALEDELAALKLNYSRLESESIKLQARIDAAAGTSVSIVQSNPKSFSEVRKSALVIGIDRYRSQSITPLGYSVLDAQAIATMLRSGGYETILLTNEAANRAAISGAMDQLSSHSNRDDIMLVFFSGHGAAVDDRPFLIPWDADEQALEMTSISLTQLSNALTRAASRVLVLLDAAIGVRAPARDAGYFSRLAASPNSSLFVLSAADEQGLAFEDKALGHGVFTYHVLQGLAGGADYRRTGSITATALATYVREASASGTPRIRSVSALSVGAENFVIWQLPNR